LVFPGEFFPTPSKMPSRTLMKKIKYIFALILQISPGKCNANSKRNANTATISHLFFAKKSA